MILRELDHLMGRECGPEEGCKRCDRRRALDGEVVVPNVRVRSEHPSLLDELLESYGWTAISLISPSESDHLQDCDLAGCPACLRLRTTMALASTPIQAPL